MLTFGSHHFDADDAGIHTLCAAFWAIVLTFLASHFKQAVLTIHEAFLTGLYTGLIHTIHIVAFLDFRISVKLPKNDRIPCCECDKF